MKQKLVNGRWMIWTPDSIADWDGGTGDPVARRGWEYERFKSFRERLTWDTVFFDVGAEHGWISAVLAQEFVNPQRMHLFEPSPEFWVNIAKIWEWNGLAKPAGMFQGFVADHTDGFPSMWQRDQFAEWPHCADVNAPEIGGMAYRSLSHPGYIHSITIDDYARVTGHYPHAINIDVEGAELMVLRGARATLAMQFGVASVWVSIHPDLMENFGHTKDELLDLMADLQYKAKHLGTDHEEHWLFTPEPRF